MQYLLSLTLNEMFVLLILLTGTIIFGIRYLVWVKSNILIFSFLILSIFMIGGNDLPIWWEYGAKHYEFIYNIGFSMFSAFLFYWVTVVRGEMKRREYYAFYSLNFLLNYYSLLSYFYLRKIFSSMRKTKKGQWKERKTSITFTKIKIEIPASKIYEIIDDRENLVKDILEEYKLWKSINESQKKDLLSKLKEDIYYKNAQKEIQEEFEKNIDKTYSYENTYIYKIYSEICKNRKEFKEELNYYSNLGNFEEVDNIRYILNYSEENLSGDIFQMKYFIKNYEYIECKILPLIKENMNILISGKRYIPPITLNLNSTNFGVLDEEVFYKLINYFYKENTKFYYDNKTKTKKRILNITEKDNEYFFVFEEGAIKIKDLDLREISLELNEVLIN